jgi:hypothetical protein
MLGSWEAQLHYLRGPIIDDRFAKRSLVYVGSDVLAPPRREPIKLIVILRGVTVRITLKIGNADMRNDVDVFERRQTLKQIERQCPEIVGVEKGEM